MTKDYHKIHSEFDDLIEKFKEQVIDLEPNTKEFHELLIKLTAKRPKQEELLQFVVFINDNLYRSQSMFVDMVLNVFIEFAELQKETLKNTKNAEEKILNLENEIKLLKVKNEKKPFNFLKIIETFKNIKITVTFLTIIVVGIISLTAGDGVSFSEILEKILKIK